MASLTELLDAQKRFQEQLMKKSGVVGVAVGYRNYKGEATEQLALVALVERKLPVDSISRDDLVPRDIDGATTDVYEVGRIEALQTVNPRSRIRPTMPGGISVGHYQITAGTLGVVVYDRTTGEKLLLSNNHVLANSNEAMIGDDILQPGPVDGGSRPADTVAWLERFVKLQFVGDEPPPSTDPEPTPEPDPDPEPTPDPLPPGTGDDPIPTPDPDPEPTPEPDPDDGTDPTPTTPATSECDIVNVIATFGNVLAKLNGSEQRLSATASSAATTTTATASATTTTTAQYTPNNRVDCAVARPVNPDAFSDEITGIGAITDTRLPALGLSIRKSGRTTGYTEGMITLLNATVNVGYTTSEGSKTARFTGQVIATAMSQGGDSGSLIVDKNSQSAVGLLFAGSSVATIFTPIDIVLDTLNLRLGS